jgi:hypothetical protein
MTMTTGLSSDPTEIVVERPRSVPPDEMVSDPPLE